MPTALRLVAVVDGEDTLRESVCRALRLENVRAEGFATSAAADASFSRALPDLMIAAIAADPGTVDLFRRFRSRSPSLPIIAVPASEDDLDAVLAMRLEADDYLPKPFSLKELLPRVTALLRRAALTGAETLAWEDRPLTLGPLTVDPLRLSAQWAGKPLGLTVTEFFILHSLVRRAGVVKTRDQLLRDAFPGRSGGEGTIEGHMGRIRRKFEALEPDFDSVEGVHGAGYRYRAGPRR